MGNQYKSAKSCLKSSHYSIQSVIFEANDNKLPAYYGQYSSSFKQLFEEEEKKKIQELISDADELPSMPLASERIENQPKEI